MWKLKGEELMNPLNIKLPTLRYCGAIILALLPITCAAQAPQPSEAKKYDEFPNITCEDEMAHLDNFAIELQNDPKLQAYVVVYAGRVSLINEAIARAKRIRLYLVKNRGIESKRITLIDGGYREKLGVELWVLSRRGKVPMPAPMLTRRDVKVRNKRARVTDCAGEY